MDLKTLTCNPSRIVLDADLLHSIRCLENSTTTCANISPLVHPRSAWCSEYTKRVTSLNRTKQPLLKPLPLLITSGAHSRYPCLPPKVHSEFFKFIQYPTPACQE